MVTTEYRGFYTESLFAIPRVLCYAEEADVRHSAAGETSLIT